MIEINLERKERKYFFLASMTGFVNAAFLVAIPFSVSVVLEMLSSGNDVGYVKVGIWLLVFAVITGIIYVLKTYLANKFILLVKFRMEQEFVKSSFANNYQPETSISVFNNDIPRIVEKKYGKLIDCVCSLSFCIMGLIYSSLISFKALAIELLFLIIAMMYQKKAIPYINRLEKKYIQTREKLNEKICDFIKARISIFSFSSVEYAKKTNFEIIQKKNEIEAMRESKKSKINLFLGMIPTLATVVVCLLVGMLFDNGKIDREFGLSIAYISQYIVWEIIKYYRIKNGITSVKATEDRLKELIGKDSKRNDWYFTNLSKRETKICNVTLVCQNHVILNNINLSIEKGKKYLLLGTSGSGKTKLLNLLAGEIDSEDGTIAGNVEVNFAGVNYVRQNIDIIPGTIADNIAFSDEYDETTIALLLDNVNLDRRLTDNQLLETYSGGEKRKIGIARAKYFQTDTILLCDEPFENLDVQSYYPLYDFVENYPGTVVFSSHILNEKITNIFDEVIFLEGGSVLYTGIVQEMPELIKQYCKE